MANNRSGRVDVNTAGAEELKRIEGIDGERARIILQHREQHGRFASWEEFEQISGIGPVLTQKAQEAGTLGDAAADKGAGDDAAPARTLELDESDVLTTMAMLDLEAALAYDACAEIVGEKDVQKSLLQFRDDHFRHVEALNAVLERKGGARVEQAAASQLLRRIALIASALGADAALIALLTNEELTNEVYEMAEEIEWDPELEQMLERHTADEKRHFEYLSDLVQRLAQEEAEQAELPV